jgi:cytochrome oxidase Cu insertion factor (SCO1/SenC/PrrC family)
MLHSSTAAQDPDRTPDHERFARMTGKVGKPAVDFELKDASGAVHRLHDYDGHWLLLVFHRHLG